MSIWKLDNCRECDRPKMMPPRAKRCGKCEERQEKREPGFPRRKKRGAA